MPILRNLMYERVEPVLRLTVCDEQQDGIDNNGFRVSAALYEVWAASDLWHMAGGADTPILVVSQRVGREVKENEFADAVASAVNTMLGYEGCRRVGKDRIRADGTETVAKIVAALLNRNRGRSMLSSVIGCLRS